MEEKASCINCRYCRQNGSDYVCDKIAENLLGLKGCGNHVFRSPFEVPDRASCGVKKNESERAAYDCI